MSDSRRRVYQILGLVTVAIAVVAVLVAVLASPAPSPLRPGRPVPGSNAALELFAGIPQSASRLGAATAPVTLVEFGDLQCPYCAYFATHALPELVSGYVRTGRLQIIFRGLDGLGSDSRRAAAMAYALAEQNHLWQFVDLAYRNQRAENSGYVTDAFLQAIAGAIPGVDVQRAMQARHSTAVSQQIGLAMSSARQLHLNATPSFELFATGQSPRRFSPQALNSEAFTSALEQILRSHDSAIQ
jgi:protein-disulfide isomerase